MERGIGAILWEILRIEFQNGLLTSISPPLPWISRISDLEEICDLIYVAQ